MTSFTGDIKTTGASHATTFIDIYTSLRSREQRIYTDEVVAGLPAVPEDHAHKKEWRIRQTSFNKLRRHLQKKQNGLRILEVGCGNGWLSYGLSRIAGADVTGLDINHTELEQAKRVFGYHKNLRFIQGDIYTSGIGQKSFDVIVFAASIQYFPDFTGTIRKTLSLLKSAGEIHIIDSRFYSEKELGLARQRSANYFRSAGHEDMTSFYFHCSLHDIENFNHHVLYNPRNPWKRIFGSRSPFYWIQIIKEP